jgi:hypothetical protein
METVSAFRVLYLETPPGYQPRDEYIRHTATTSLDALKADVVALFDSPAGQQMRSNAMAIYSVILDVVATDAGDGTEALEYVVASPTFLDGGSVETQTTGLCELVRDLLVTQFPCSPVEYSGGFAR